MAAEPTATFAEHIQELRSRLMWSMLFVAIGAGVGYVLHDKLLIILQQPLHESLYYTTPTGAFSFIMKICAVFGLVVALPAMLYHSFAFFEPLLNRRLRRSIVLYVLLSFALACLGITFAYFISLPAALHFLVNFGSDGGIESLITANEYFNFVLAYIAGFAVLFQLPLIITFINRIKPLTTGKLMGGTRYVVLASFVVAAIITPTPDPLNQALMAGPIILLYFASVSVVAAINMKARRRQRKLEADTSVIDEAAIAVAMEPEVSKPAPDAPAVARAPAPRPMVTAARRPVMVNDVMLPGRNVAVPSYQSRKVTPQLSVQVLQEPKPAQPVRLISDVMPVSK